MNFTTYSEKDLPTNLLEKGEYHVEVFEATDATSQSSGDDMIKLNVAVWVEDKVRCRIFDYLIDSMPAKLRHACDTFGILSKYETGRLSASDFNGKSGRAKIDIQVDKNGQYPDKNVIKDYICRSKKRIDNNSPNNRNNFNDNAPPHTDDDLPF